MNKENVIQTEFIGRTIEVHQKNSNKKVKGKVIDETKNMLTILTEDDRRKKMVKSQVTLMIGGAKIEGRLICERPEDRIRLKMVR